MLPPSTSKTFISACYNLMRFQVLDTMQLCIMGYSPLIVLQGWYTVQYTLTILFPQA